MAEVAYDWAADHFDGAPLGFWKRYGRRTIERLGLVPGERVLDVCCGSGASALPAAHAVGPTGSVLAVDLAENLLRLGRRKAEAAGLRWLEFRRGDMANLGLADGSFDAVVCVFGIFFARNLEQQLRDLWRLLRPHGQLAITTWGPEMFAPAYEHWIEAVQAVRPDLVSAFHPWDRIVTAEAVRRMFEDAGIEDVRVEARTGWQPLRVPDDFWTIALGTGLRWTIEHLGEARAAMVRHAVVTALAARRVNRVATNVIYAVARRPRT